ncbi:hypothetical protein [Sphingobium amiense]|uniref:hypothetical protein n=1 Tax=Sphingobium amiense TaxID=135719 RepID=UPI000831F493|nr:hypothetical protein [Sphingobium amiense]
MAEWRPGFAAKAALRLTGLALLAGLRPESRWLHAAVLRSAATTPAQALLAMLCFVTASAGVALLLLGPDLWKPVAVAPRWRSADHGAG